jgi:eukaryotic-like serine/threonine-protein kinase
VPLEGGVKLGRYEIIEHIGAGGMGDVYSARDATLDRVVAIKTVAAGFAQNPLAIPRFDLERKIGAHLEHPHICRLLDAGRERGIDFLAMEFLHGENLASRLVRGPLPIREALGHGIEIAEALEYAHQHGVVHRDVKPANVFLTPHGAKVLDFGLARTSLGTLSGAARDASTAPLSAPGATPPLLGSAPYVAPERLLGGDVDARTDVFGFGLVLYEMLTARRAFDGTSAAAVTGAILHSEPPPLNLRSPSGEELEWVVRKCLSKRPEDRWCSLGDVGFVLKRIAGRQQARVASLTRPGLGSWVAMGAVLLTVLAIAGLFAWMNRRADGRPASRVVFTIPPPPGGAFTLTEGSVQTPQLAVAPDGRSIVFVARGSESLSQLWIRHTDAVASKPVPGTQGAAYPFWSPDGKSIGFFTGRDLRRIELAGGPPRTLATAPNGRGGSWSQDGQILFAANTTSGIFRVSASGGTVEPVTTVDTSRGQTSHRWPAFLPDGRRFLFFARSAQQTEEGIYLGSLDTPGVTKIVNSGFGGVYLHPDRILFIEEGSLLVRRFDPASGRALGEPSLVAGQVGGSSNFYGAFSASSEGVIAYAGIDMTSDLAWWTRDGMRTGVVARTDRHVDFDLSPNGRQLALAAVSSDTGFSDLFVLDLIRGTRTRLTTGRATDASPLWSADGNALLFRSNPNGVHDLFLKAATGNGGEREVYRTLAAKYPTSWSKNGRSVLFHTREEKTAWDVWLATVGDDQYRFGEARPLLQSAFNEMQAKLSPEGQWVAYTSDESGQSEVYALSLATNDRIPISVGGGADPHWRDDGREIFYISSVGEMTSVTIGYRERKLEPGAPKPLFRVGSGTPAAPYLSVYDVAPAGTRFLVREINQDPRSLPLTVLVNCCTE